MVKITSNVYLKYSFVREVKVKKYITNRSYVVGTKQGQLVQKGFVNLQKKKQFSSCSIVFAPHFIMRRKCFKLRLLIRNYSHCLSFNQLM